jgi:glycosyltransferase involved in cell wall biosynthesis
MARICMLAYSHYSTDPRIRREAEALAARGDDISCISLMEKSPEPWELNGVKLLPVPMGRYRGGSAGSYFRSYLSFFARAALLLTRHHLRDRFDVVQVHTMPDFMVFAAAVPKLLGAKVVLDVHDLMPELYMSKFGLDAAHPLIRFITWMERASIGFAHRAIAVHEPHRDLLVRHGSPKDKFSILINLPDPAVFDRAKSIPRDDDGRFRLLYHGTISRRHGLETAIRAVGLLKDRIPAIELSILGGGDYRDGLVALTAELGLEPWVSFSPGMVPLESLPARIRQADLGLVPLLEDPFTRYMLPIKLLEYVGLSIPVVASRTMTMQHYFDDSMVRYVAPGDAAGLASTVLELHDRPELRRELVASASRFNRQFEWSSHKSVYYELMDGLTAPAPGPLAVPGLSGGKNH